MDKWLSYYHPSTAVFVDDQPAFLSAIKNRLPKEMIALFFSNPNEALKKIQHAACPTYNNPHSIDEIKEDLEVDIHKNNEAYFNLKLGRVAETIYNPKRFSEISVVIVDRMMPGLDGINFCRQLTNYPAKKIMLTASKDRTIATEAFNEGIIDFFLVKDSPNLSGELIGAIERMQKNYFFSLSKRMFGNTLDIAVPLISSQPIINLLQQTRKELNAVEYYLLDKYGSTLFITLEGVATTLAISSDEVIGNYAAIANEHEEQSIAQVLRKKEKLLFFPNESDNMRPVNEWHHFLFDAMPIPSQPSLFYSLIRGPKYQPINMNKIYAQNNLN